MDHGRRMRYHGIAEFISLLKGWQSHQVLDAAPLSYRAINSSTAWLRNGAEVARHARHLTPAPYITVALIAVPPATGTGQK